MRLALIVVTIVAGARAFVLQSVAAPLPTPAALHTRRCCTITASDEPQIGKKIEGSSLTLTPEQLEERNVKRAQINRLLPAVVIGAFALNALTGGALENIELPKGPSPPGLEEARKLKADKGYK